MADHRSPDAIPPSIKISSFRKTIRNRFPAFDESARPLIVA